VTERITLRIMVRTDGVVRVMFYHTADAEVMRENWGCLPRKTQWTPRQRKILADIDQVRCVQWRDGGWKSLLGETQ
jgi:hypothetical protein